MADARLASHFDPVVASAGGSIRAALVSKKVSKKKGPANKPLSAGYGFVECSSEASAKVALRKLQANPLVLPRSTFLAPYRQQV